MVQDAARRVSMDVTPGELQDSEKRFEVRGFVESIFARMDENRWREIEERIGKLPTKLNEYGYDPFGMCPDKTKIAFILTSWLHDFYFRVQSVGIEKIPPGRVMIAANHSGQLPFDGAMMATNIFLHGNPPRMVRGMVEKFAAEAPFVGTFFNRHGQIVGLPENCRQVLYNDGAILVFPEGVKGIAKSWRKRYQLAPFGTGFMRLALQTNTPIVPAAIVGAEEQYFSLANAQRVARILGLPSFPITPFFPWLGPIGLIPFPVKYRIAYGDPISSDGNPDDEDEVVLQRIDNVKTAIKSLLEQELRKRKGIFN